MARTTVDMETGVAPRAPIDGSANTGTGALTYDIFVGNQGEGAMNVTLDWTNLSSVFIPPHAHRDTVDLTVGDVVHLDSLEILQLVVRQDAGADPFTFGATGQKTHVTAASTGNDYLVVGIGARS